MLHLNVLQLFVDKRTIIHLPNCSIMNLTRESCKAAFRNGISTQQISDFLEIHSHPIVRSGTADRVGASVVPTNIKDQLRLWEQEQDRVEIMQCFKLICINNAEFDAVVRWAEFRDVGDSTESLATTVEEGEDAGLLFKLRKEVSERVWMTREERSDEPFEHPQGRPHAIFESQRFALGRS